jgi:GT2 family glycosyltransferase
VDADSLHSAPIASIVILTYARDDTLKATLAHLKAKRADWDAIEIVLVDNNPDALDRTEILSGFPIGQVIKTGANKGVSARNDGMAAARGEMIVLLDDDVLVETGDFLERFKADFDAQPDIGLVMVKKLDAATGAFLPECVPHTDKSVDVSRPFVTFRFVGGLVALRKVMFDQVGGFSPEFFFGVEENEYSYRIIKAGWKILFDPEIVALETNASGGRMNRIDRATETLSGRYRIAYLHMPLLSAWANAVLFTVFLMIHERGKVDVIRALRTFTGWLATPGHTRRASIDRRTRDYILECGGVTWR